MKCKNKDDGYQLDSICTVRTMYDKYDIFKHFGHMAWYMCIWAKAIYFFPVQFFYCVVALFAQFKKSPTTFEYMI